MTYLPGNFRQRVQELLKQHDMNAEDLAKLLGVSTDTVRRMLKASEGGEDGSPKVSVDAIIKMARYFNVSTDFLLGITNMPDPMNYPVEQLRLTEGAAKAILSRRVHMDMLNRLLENIQFGQLTYTMYYATEPNQTAGIMSRNNLLSYTSSLYAKTADYGTELQTGF